MALILLDGRSGFIYYELLRFGTYYFPAYLSDKGFIERRKGTMKELDQFMKTVGEGLRALAQGVNSVAEKLDRFLESRTTSPEDQPESAPEVPVEVEKETSDQQVLKPASGRNATAVVSELIQKSPKPVKLEELAQKTGFDKRKLQGILYHLKKQGKIVSAGKGIYRKAS